MKTSIEIRKKLLERARWKTAIRWATGIWLMGYAPDKRQKMTITTIRKMITASKKEVSDGQHNK